MKHLSNNPCRILNAQQNATVFKMLQPNCKSLATTIATLYFYVNQVWIKQFSGILCFERDTKKKIYYLRFYRNCFSDAPEMVLQQKVKPAGVHFVLVRDLLFQMKIGCRSIGFQFMNSPEGYEESSEMAMALRGNMKALKRDAEARYYEEHPEKQKESRFKRIFHWKQRRKKKEEEKQNKLSPKDIKAPIDSRHVQHLGTDDGQNAIIDDWTTDPVMRRMLIQMGLEYEQVLRSHECRERLENMIKKYGGLENFRKDAIKKGFATQSIVKRNEPAAAQQKAASSDSDTGVMKTNKLKRPQTLHDPPPRSQKSLDSFDRVMFKNDEPSILDTPIGELNDSWFRVNDDLDYILPTMPIWKPEQPAAKAAEPTPARTPMITDSMDAPTPSVPGTDYIEEYEETWMKVAEDVSHFAPPPRIKRIGPLQNAPERAKPSELLNEITQFDPKKAYKVPVMYTSTPQKPTAPVPPMRIPADVGSAETLAIELNKTIDEIQILTKAEKQTLRGKKGLKSSDKKKTDSSVSEISSDSESDSDSDEENSQQTK